MKVFEVQSRMVWVGAESKDEVLNFYQEMGVKVEEEDVLELQENKRVWVYIDETTQKERENCRKFKIVDQDIKFTEMDTREFMRRDDFDKVYELNIVEGME